MNSIKMGKLLRAARRNARMTQDEAGALINRSGNYVSSCELRKEDKDEFRYSEMLTLCKAYNVNFVDLCEKASQTTCYSVAGKIDMTQAANFRIDEVRSAFSELCKQHNWDFEVEFKPTEETPCAANTDTETA